MRHRRPTRNRLGLTRREFIAGAVISAADLAVPGCGGGNSSVSGSGVSASALPLPEDSGIDHIVVVMMENRSFDHFLGWVPGADGVQAGTTLKDTSGNSFSSHDLAPNYQNFNLADPDHSYAGGRTEINGGNMDGFLLTQPVGDTFPLGYYTAASLPFYQGCAANWTICDRYFSGILSSTSPNRIYMHAGQTDRLSNTVAISSLPTIWDSMLAAGRSVAYYYTDVPYTSFWGSKYQSFSKQYTMASFAADIAAGTLADLTFVDNVGNIFDEATGVSKDDHPFADVRDGQAFLNNVYDALRQSPQWDRTLVIINYDEWGGFYDHVAPPFAPVTAVESALGNDGRLGCRVPCVLMGPRARRGHVEHLQFDPNSILNMIAWRFGFEPLGARGDSNNIALALDFENPPDPSVPAFSVPQGPFGQQCVPQDELGAVGIPVDIPITVCVPLQTPILLPPIPGLDVPLALARTASGESAIRRADHEKELQDLRELAGRYGFETAPAWYQAHPAPNSP